MALHITPDLMEISYQRLCLTPPFKRWRLPHADNVEFHVVGDVKVEGAFCYDTEDARKAVIRVSHIFVRTLDKLDAVMAHEICHLRERLLKVRSDVAHGRVFQKLADQVCSYHGFDRGHF